MQIGMSGHGQGRSRGRPPGPGRPRGGRGAHGSQSSNQGQDQESQVVRRGRGRPRKQPDTNDNVLSAPQQNLDEIDPGLGTSRGPCAPALSHPLIPQYESEESDESDEEDVLNGAEIEEPSSESEDESTTVRQRKDRLIKDLHSALEPENYNR